MEESAPENVVFAIYPNPASDYIQVAIPENLDNKIITIYDNSGTLIHQSKPEKEASESVIDLSRLREGIYILNFKSDQKSWSKKLIKK
ncbi:T9SS type A sorting domain-containing protein [Flavobacterium sp. P21]|uniref:T9SS type A sorting domain-containing protein n=1 Tax=Flavobacterium sp. P21 TaxID=3423948 RepID=UPI003D66ABFE